MNVSMLLGAGGTTSTNEESPSVDDAAINESSILDEGEIFWLEKSSFSRRVFAPFLRSTKSARTFLQRRK